MKKLRGILFCLLAAVLVLSAPAVTTAWAEDYRDGDYTVAFSMDGLGRHNVAWDTATVHVKDGKLYVDFTLERVDPRNHPPQYDWLKTECGTFYPTLDEEAYTCTFTWVEVPHLGSVDVVAYSASMATEIDYTIHIDGSAVPSASQTDPDTPVSSDDPPRQPGEPGGDVSAPVSPETLTYDANHLPLSTGAVIAIAAVAAAVLGCAAWLLLRGRRK